MKRFLSKTKNWFLGKLPFLKSNIFIIVLVCILFYQNSRISELEDDLGAGFAFETTTNIVDRLADQVRDISSKIEDIEGDASSSNGDLDDRLTQLEYKTNDLESSIDSLENRIDDLESSMRRIRLGLSY